MEPFALRLLSACSTNSVEGAISETGEAAEAGMPTEHCHADGHAFYQYRRRK